MLTRLNILILEDMVLFMDLSNTNRTTLVHCMNRTLFGQLVDYWGADNQHLMCAVQNYANSFHTVTVPADRMYETIMQSDPVTEGQHEHRVFLSVNQVSILNVGSIALKADVQWASKENRIIAKSLYDSAHHIAWYSYESMRRTDDRFILALFSGKQPITIDDEIFDALASPNFFDLFAREPILLAAFAGFEANMRVRNQKRPVKPQPVSEQLSDRPLKDIKDLLCRMGMNENDAISLAGNMGQAGFSIGSELHNEIIRDIRDMLINKIKHN